MWKCDDCGGVYSTQLQAERKADKTHDTRGRHTCMGSYKKSLKDVVTEGRLLEMFCWVPGKARSKKEEIQIPWRFAGWRLSKTSQKVVYILKLNGEDFLHFHVETEALVTTPRSTLRRYLVK